MQISAINIHLCTHHRNEATDGAFEVELLPDPLPQLHNGKSISRFLVVASLGLDSESESFGGGIVGMSPSVTVVRKYLDEDDTGSDGGVGGVDDNHRSSAHTTGGHGSLFSRSEFLVNLQKDLTKSTMLVNMVNSKRLENGEKDDSTRRRERENNDSDSSVGGSEDYSPEFSLKYVGDQASNYEYNSNSDSDSSGSDPPEMMGRSMSMGNAHDLGLDNPETGGGGGGGKSKENTPAKAPSALGVPLGKKMSDKSR
jgi:hypothetical protein